MPITPGSASGTVEDADLARATILRDGDTWIVQQSYIVGSETKTVKVALTGTEEGALNTMWTTLKAKAKADIAAAEGIS